MLEELNIKSPHDLRDLEVLAYYRAALVRCAQLEECEARLSVVGPKAIITISNRVTKPHRQRFSIAHELGHLEMHRHISEVVICTERYLNEWGQKKRRLEHEANLFAAAFLLPRALFEPLCGLDDPSLDPISQLARRFQVSLTATALRFVRFCPEPVIIVCSEVGRVRWFGSNDSFQELGVYIESNVRLDPLSNASRAAGDQRYQAPRQVSTSAWFAKGRYFDDALIFEHSWNIPRYDAILTLLWVNDDIVDGDDFTWV